MTRQSTTDLDHHLYVSDEPCWVIHRPGQDTDDELPHYSTKAAADRAATEGDRWWDGDLAAGGVLQVDQLDSRCLTGCCAECESPVGDEPYHFTCWEEIAEQAEYAAGDRLDYAWQTDHDTHRIWCGGCKVTRRTPADHEDTFGLWMGPQTRCQTVDILHLLTNDRVIVSPDAIATVTATTTPHPHDRTATVHTDKGDYTVTLPCTARQVL